MGVETLLLPPCYRNLDNLRPDGPVSSRVDFVLVYKNCLIDMLNTLVSDRAKKTADLLKCDTDLTRHKLIYLSDFAKTCPLGSHLDPGAASATLHPNGTRLACGHGPGTNLPTGGLLAASCRKHGEGRMSCTDPSTWLD